VATPVDEMAVMVLDTFFAHAITLRSDRINDLAGAPCYGMDPLDFYDAYEAAITATQSSHIGKPGIVAARAAGTCNVFDPWVQWERGQVGI